MITLTKIGATICANPPRALDIPIRTPANLGAMSKWLMIKPENWKPQNDMPITTIQMLIITCRQSRKPIMINNTAGIRLPVNDIHKHSF